MSWTSWITEIIALKCRAGHAKQNLYIFTEWKIKTKFIYRLHFTRSYRIECMHWYLRKCNNFFSQLNVYSVQASCLIVCSNIRYKYLAISSFTTKTLRANTKWRANECCQLCLKSISDCNLGFSFSFVYILTQNWSREGSGHYGKFQVVIR